MKQNNEQGHCNVMCVVTANKTVFSIKSEIYESFEVNLDEKNGPLFA